MEIVLRGGRGDVINGWLLADDSFEQVEGEEKVKIRASERVISPVSLKSNLAWHS